MGHTSKGRSWKRGECREETLLFCGSMPMNLCAVQYDLLRNDPSIKNVTALKNVFVQFTHEAYSHGIAYMKLSVIQWRS